MQFILFKVAVMGVKVILKSLCGVHDEVFVKDRSISSFKKTNVIFLEFGIISLCVSQRISIVLYYMFKYS